MVEASILVSLFMYVFLLPGFHVVLFSRYCVLVFPSAFAFIMSANLVLMFIVVMVSVWWKLIGTNRGRYCHRVARIILVCLFRVPGGCPFYHRSKSKGGGIKMAAAICTVEAAIFTILK